MRNCFLPVGGMYYNAPNLGDTTYSCFIALTFTGSSPFLVDQELHTEEAIIGPGKPWPERYQQLQ